MIKIHSQFQRLVGRACVAVTIAPFLFAATAQPLPLGVKIVQPADGESINLDAADLWSVRVAAQVAGGGGGGGGGLVQVEFFGDGHSLGTRTGNPASASPINPFQLGWLNPASGEHSVVAVATDANGAAARSGTVKFKVVRHGEVPLPAVATIVALKNEASEAGDLKSRSLMFEVKRKGGVLLFPMVVFYDLGGAATPGEDYLVGGSPNEIPPDPADGDPTVPGWNSLRSVVIPAGAEATTLMLIVQGDSLLEGGESVDVALHPSPLLRPFNPLTDYVIGEPGKAGGVILDSPPTGSSLVLTSPHELQVFDGPADVLIEAIAVDPKSAINVVAFFANDTFIGESGIVWDIEPPPGSPIKHSLLWKNVPPGKYILTAKAKDSSGHELLSGPVRIAVNFPNPSDVPFVTIETTDPEAAEPDPANIGAFRISRSGGDLTLPLKVLFKTHGNADRGGDYVLIPESMFIPCPACDRPEIIIDGNTIEIPSGEKSVRLGVRAVPDKALEGTEDAAVEIVSPDAANDPAIPPGYRVGLPSSAHVAIIEGPDAPPRAQLVLISPGNEKIYQAPADILVQAVGWDPKGAITHVDFFAGDQKIGESDIVFLQPPEPGIKLTHEFLWKAVPPGDYKITARSFDANGDALISDPVVVHVLAEPPSLAFLTITHPESGAAYPGPQDRIRISIQGQDPGGLVETVEVFVNGSKVGDAQFCCPECKCLAPEPGKPTPFTFDWLNVPAGVFEIIARGTSTSGLVLKSEPIKIFVKGEPPPPLAFLKITHPEPGTVYPAPQEPLTISLLSQDPIGVFEKIEIFANGDKLGDAQYCCPVCDCLAPAPGKPSLHTFIWNNVPAGVYELVARGKSTSGLELQSNLVRIVVGGAPDDPPLVTIQLKDEIAREADPADIAIFRLFRTGPTGSPLTVHFEVHGTAERGVDYDLIPESMFVPCPECDRPQIIIPGNTIEIPAGESSLLLGARAVPDKALEGVESIGVEVTSPPVIAIPNARPPYLPGRPAEARAVILEGPVEPWPARIVINHPDDGDRFLAPATIEIVATAVDPRGAIPRVEFLAGDDVIGVSEIVFIREPDPGTPIQHSFTWKNVPTGEYKLRVRGLDSAGQRVVSEPIRIVVGNTSEPVVVTVKATDPEASEPGAFLDHPHHGTFTLTRTGSTRLPLAVFYKTGGTAENGTDYVRLDGDAVIPAGSHTRNITVVPHPDNLVEGPESVELALADGSGYQVGDPHAARIVIRDADRPDDRAPRLEITEPDNGDHFRAPADIAITAVAIDPDGYISRVEFFANGKSIGVSELAFFQAPDPGSPITHTLDWKSVPAGSYKLTAHCVDDSGLEATSETVKIVVLGEPEPPDGFVVRGLPDFYLPGQKLLVTLNAKPGDDVESHGIEETPPKGWAVGAISHHGGFDASTGKLKFGPFLDHESRALTYELTPPADARGVVEFGGIASADGADSRVLGDRHLAPILRHPADLNPADNSLVLAEVTAYSAAWKSGETWPEDPNPIPVAYVTRAGALWRGGEDYLFDPSAGPAPLWWVNPSPANPVVKAGPPPIAGVSFAMREYSLSADGAWNVAIRVLPRPGVASFAVEEILPDSAHAEGVSDEGAFDTKAGVVRWGPFTDGEARTLKYVMQGSEPSARPERLRGIASFDGENFSVLRTAPPPDAGEAKPRGAHLVDVSPVGDDAVQITLEGEPDAAGYDLEVSADLKTWVKAGAFQAGDFSFFSLDIRPKGEDRRFYRAVRRP